MSDIDRSIDEWSIFAPAERRTGSRSKQGYTPLVVVNQARFACPFRQSKQTLSTRLILQPEIGTVLIQISQQEAMKVAC